MVAAQEAAKLLSMGIQLQPHPEGFEIAFVLPERTGAALGLLAIGGAGGGIALWSCRRFEAGGFKRTQ